MVLTCTIKIPSDIVFILPLRNKPFMIFLLDFGFDEIYHHLWCCQNYIHSPWRWSTRFMVASVGVPTGGYGHGGPGACVGDCQTEAEGVSSQGGRGDASLLRMPPYLTWPGRLAMRSHLALSNNDKLPLRPGSGCVIYKTWSSLANTMLSVIDWHNSSFNLGLEFFVILFQGENFKAGGQNWRTVWSP